MLPTLIWGVPTGAKLALVGSFALAGLAQWWLGHVLGLGPVARIWTAAIAVTAGHLSGRMEHGNFAVMPSLAACSLALPALVSFARSGSRPSAAALGLVLGLAAISGQGYFQIALAFLLPSIVLLVRWDRAHLALLARRLAMAGAIALLVAAPFLVPFLHFLPEFGKALDPQFRAAQPFTFVLLNLVIDDPAFYRTEALHKQPFPMLYVNFIGWIPFAMAAWALRGGRDRSEHRTIAFLVAFALGALWLASGAPLMWLSQHLPIPPLAEQFDRLRSHPAMASLAVPPILALAGMTVDRTENARWMRFSIHLGIGERQPHRIFLDLRWLMAIPLALSLAATASFSRNWIGTAPQWPGVPLIVEALHTPDLQWVNPPYGEHPFIEPGVGEGLKVSAGLQPWSWKGRRDPEPFREANRTGVPPGAIERARVQGAWIFEVPGREYAAIEHSGGGRTVCSAHGLAGDIDVRCEAALPGTLVVKENSWSGWQAWKDGGHVPLRSDRWLSVELPAGPQTVQFRYRPWDVPVGLALSLCGIALAIYAWRHEEGSDERSERRT